MGWLQIAKAASCSVAFIVIVVFRLNSGFLTRKCQCHCKSPLVPGAPVHVVFLCCLVCPGFGCSHPCPVPRVPWQSCSAALVPATALLLRLPGARGGCCVLSQNIFILWAVPWSCCPVRPATSMWSASQPSLAENLVFLLCSIPEKLLLHSCTTQLPGFCP